MYTQVIGQNGNITRDGVWSVEAGPNHVSELKIKEVDVASQPWRLARGGSLKVENGARLDGVNALARIGDVIEGDGSIFFHTLARQWRRLWSPFTKGWVYYLCGLPTLSPSYWSTLVTPFVVPFLMRHAYLTGGWWC